MDQINIPAIVDVLANDVWSDADIDNRVRSIVAGYVSVERQDELRTIMLGHIAQMRAATASEMGEIILVKTVTEAAADAGRQARADMALLSQAMAYEAAQARLSRPLFDGPATVMQSAGLDATPVEVPNPAMEADTAERAAAQAAIDGATQAVLDLLVLRHPAPVAEQPADSSPEVLP